MITTFASYIPMRNESILALITQLLRFETSIYKRNIIIFWHTFGASFLPCIYGNMMFCNSLGRANEGDQAT